MSGLGSFAVEVLSDAVLALPLIGIYILFAVGVVVIYRASRVLNLAHGAFALVPAYVFYSLARFHVGGAHLPLLVCAVIAVAGGAAMGLLTERVVVRRLRPQGPVAQTVGTIAVFGFVVAVAVKLYGSAPILPARLLPTGSIAVGNGSLRVAALWIFVIGSALTALCLALFRFTDLGLAMRSAADNRRGASLMGVDPDQTTAMAWALGGALAGVAGVLEGTYGNIDAFTLGLLVLPAFVAALIGGLENLTGALLGCVLVGLVQSEVSAVATLPGLHALGTTAGIPQLVLVIISFVLLVTRGQKLVAGQPRDASLVPPVRRAFSAMRPRRRRGNAGMTTVGICLVIFPFLPFIPFSVVGDAIQAWFYLLAALSIVLLTGWVGQISLAQAELMGVGAFVTALITNHGGVPFPLSMLIAAVAGGVVAAVLGGVALRVRGLYLAIATLVFAWMADAYLFHQEWFGIVGGSAQATAPGIGNPNALPYLDFTSPKLVYIVALVVTAAVLYAVANLADSKTGRAFFALRGSEVAAASLGIDVTRYKLLAFALAGVIAGIAGNLTILYQRSVEPSQFSLLASLFVLGIAVVGGITSLSGSVAAALVFAALSEVFLRVHALAGFLDIVSSGLLLAVLLGYPGGLSALAAAAADRWAATAPARQQVRTAMIAAARAVADPVAARARTLTPLRATAGSPDVADLPADTADRGDAGTPLAPILRLVARAVPRRRDPLGARWTPEPGDLLTRLNPPGNGPEAEAITAAPPATTELGVDADPGENMPAAEAEDELSDAAAASRFAVPPPLPRTERLSGPALLHIEDVTVRFGGLTAVRGAALEVRSGEIVGLIGPNGAGKTTLFNAISGLVTPTSGVVELLGVDVTGRDVHERARLGVGRTFQAVQLLPQLTVFENLLVATHLRNHSSLLGHAFALPRAITAEVRMRARVMQVLDFLDLRSAAPRLIADLPFGVLRMVELARALVTGAELLLLDEPASGLDTRESERFVDVLLYVRAELGASMLLIEHDMATVMRASDYLYVLDQGCIIAEGLPRTVQRNASVIEAYLGGAVAAGS